MKGDVGPAGPSSGGVTYVRWGRTTCPNTAELVYAGRAGGSLWSVNGGGSNYQCLTNEPQSLFFGPGTAVAAAYMHSVQYEIHEGGVPTSTAHLNNHGAPCAVCYVATRETVLMVQGRYTCPPNWTREYYGYLTTERSHAVHMRTTFECVDVNSEAAAGCQSNEDGASFYHVEPRCGCLPCPPYDDQKEMTCAVCTR